MPADDTTERLLATVGWDWMDVEDVMATLIPTIAPGKAKRTYQSRSGQHRQGIKPELTEDEQIASGARSIITDRLGSQFSSGRLERRELDDGTRQVRQRIRAEVADDRGCCPTCNRPFPEATTKLPLASSPAKPKRQRVRTRAGVVVTRDVPQWRRRETA